MQRWVASGICLLFGVLAGLTPLDGVAQGSAARASFHPKLTYSTYFGSPADRINALAVGPDGSLYLAGVTLTKLDRIDVAQWSAGGGKPFVAHLSADGTKLLYFIFLSNGTGDEARAITVDTAGNAYVTGQTQEESFPVRNALQSRCSLDSAGQCSGDAFVAKVNPRGSLVFATYLGGSGEDAGNAIAVDNLGNIYVAGSTTSQDFPLVRPAQRAGGGATDAFVAKVAADGSRLIYATYLGGSSFDEARGIAVDGAGNAYVAGTTQSLDFPTRDALQSRCVLADGDGCAGEAFVTKLSTDGSVILYSTYLGGSGGDSGAAITVDAAGDAYVAGVTSSFDFPLARPLQPALAGKSNAFVAEISREGSELRFSTYLGGSDSDQARALAIDAAGNLVVSGWTHSADFPRFDALQNACRNAAGECSGDAFVSVLDTDQGKLVFSSYLGGSGADVSQAIAVDGQGAVYVGGWTDSKDFPKTQTRDVVAAKGQTPNVAGGSFVAKIEGILPSAQTVSCGTGTNNWTGEAGDNQWTSPENWSLGRVPISTDSVCIASSFSTDTITIGVLNSGIEVISALSTGAPISFSAGPFTVSGSATFAADVAITSGHFFLSGPSSMTTLELSGGTLSGAGTLSLSGLLTWSGGAMCTVFSPTAQSCTASATQAITNANGGISFGPGYPQLTARTLNNNSMATMASSGYYLTLVDSAIVNNNSGATWDLVADAYLNGSSGTFNNAGTFEKTAGSDTSLVQTTFNNTGAVLVNSTTLDFTGGGTCSTACAGSWTVVSPGTLQFDSASFSLSGPVSGSGTVSFSSGFLNLTGSYNLTGTTNFNGAIVGFNQAGTVTFAGPVNLADGYLYGTATLTLNSPLTWTYGAMCTSYSRAEASCTIPSTQAVTNAIGGITFPVGYPTLNARTLNNQQTATMTGAGYFLSLLNNAVVNNQSAATWNLAADVSLWGTSGTFNNAGVFLKSAGTKISTIQPVFNNTGSVQMSAAKLDFTGGGTCGGSCSGSWTVAHSATLQFDSGTFALNGQVGGAGIVVFNSGTQNLTGTYNIAGGTGVTGAFVNFNGPITSVGPAKVTAGVANFVTAPVVTVVMPTLTLAGGTIAGTDNFTVSGALTWTGGAMCTVYSSQTQACTAPVTQAATNANGGITFGTAALVLDGRTLNNNQTATMSSQTFSLTLADSAVVNNGSAATWNLAADVNLDGPSGTFNNSGTFKKTAGDKTSTIQPAFTNSGTVLADVATLSFSGNFTQNAGNTSLSGGTVSMASAAVFAGGSLSGHGSLTGAVSNSGATVAPGTTSTQGKITLAGSTGSYTQSSSGTLKIKIGGTSTGQYDELVAGGVVALGGTLNVSEFNGFSPKSGETFTIITGTSISGEFSSVASGWEVTYKTASVILTFQ
ncbi:MAG: SBBP repeat-containing protein [Terriglobales bacterium]